MADDPCDIAEPREVCETGFNAAAHAFRCAVCAKTKPKHTVSLPGLARQLDVCDKCFEAQAVPLWYAVAQAALANGAEYMTDEGIEMCIAAMKYHNVTTEDFNDMVDDDLAVLAIADSAMDRLKERI